MKKICLAVLFALGIAGSGIQSYAANAAPSEPVSQPPFTNGHYVLGQYIKMNGYRSGAPTVVVVDKGSHSTYVLQLQKNGTKADVVRILTVSNAIGSLDHATPSGRFLVAMKKMYPVWVPTKSIDKKQKPVPPYNQTHKNPLGVAAIYLNAEELALHGTNEPKLIRQSASHGCIRHSNADIERIYGMVKRNTPVYIVDQFKGTVLNRSDFIKEPEHKSSDKKNEKEKADSDSVEVKPHEKLRYLTDDC